LSRSSDMVERASWSLLGDDALMLRQLERRVLIL
jgi:hypothetical protein